MSLMEPLAAESSEDGLKFETTIHEDGHQATVVRDDQGQLAYLGYVPQPTESPTSPMPPNPPRRRSQPPPPDQAISKTATEPTSRAGKQSDGLRPSMGPKAVTDAPQRSKQRGFAIPPAVKRTGTNISELQQALWAKPYRHDDDSSTSDSSTDDDEDLDAGVERTDQARTKKPHTQPRPNDQFRRFRVSNDNYHTKGKISKRDGRLAISIKDTSNKGYLAKALGAAVRKVVPLKEDEGLQDVKGQRPTAERRSSETIVAPEKIRCPPLNIVIMVIGSRGDAQPFLKIGKVLKEQYGHRVRIATHPAFREFVEQDSGLEFFSVGGDPSELMSFMVKNPGLIPSLESVRAGDIGRRREAMAEMFSGFWRACINATDDEKDVRNLRMMGKKAPFVADAIIANPASFAHVHCAEALGIPLILSFTFPYTPTRAFPHPLARIKQSNVDPGYTNFMSYPLVEMVVWQGLGDLVNDLRVKTLGLDPVSTLWAPGALYRMNVPFAYLWSPSLVPKPADWGDEIDISGFVFLDLASSFKPPDPLTDFLQNGDMPIYIGFGSIVVDDADKFTEMIFEAVKMAGVRALVSKGWGGLGGDDVPDNIFMLENTPHDWLFPRVKACVIHGGAGTTAIALKCGKPTMVVPFFGDQHFWGSMIDRAKAGPEPVPYKQLSAEKLAEGMKFCLTEEAQKNAHVLAAEIEKEGDGAENACAFFHRHFTLSGKNSMRCSILEDRVAVWNLKDTSLRLSALAADILVEKGIINWRKLRLIRHCEWNDFEGPGEPVTGVLGSVAGTFGEVFGGIGGVPARLAKVSNKRRERKQRHRKKYEENVDTKGTAKDNDTQNASAVGPKPITAKSTSSKAPEVDSRQSHMDEYPHSPQTTKESAERNGTEDDGDRASTHTNTTAPTTADGDDPDYVDEVTEGALKTAGAIASAPVDLSIALAQGFHNAPRLYGDDTVRRPTRVTGIRSGLRAARSEFLYGIYDGWTGVVRLPIRGARNGGGVVGFTKGIGMGLTGFVLKDIAALIGPVGYTLKGVKKQIERRRQPSRLIRRARISQGQRELGDLSKEELDRVTKDVEKGWLVFRSLWETVEKKEKDKGGLNAQFSSRKARGVGEAFENVQMAKRALKAVRQGDKVSDVVKEYRDTEDVEKKRSQELRRPVESNEVRSSQSKGVDHDGCEGEVKKSNVTEPIQEGDERPAPAPMDNGGKSVY